MLDCLCAYCGNPFQRFPSQATLSHQYCSRLCNNLAQRVPIAERFWQHVQSCSHENLCIYCCWPWLGKRRHQRYGVTTVLHKEYVAHRYSWALHNEQPYPPSSLIIRHLCHNPPCCNPAHLACGTIADNNRDRVLAGRGPHGETVTTSKLTNTQVRAIRILRQQGVSAETIGAQFGVSSTNILHISKHRIWRHLITPDDVPVSGLPRGEKHPRAKFTDAQIRDIRHLHAEGWTCVALGAHYQASDETIRCIIHRKTWRHVD